METKFTNEQILANPFLGLAFTSDKYSYLKEEFLSNAQKAEFVPPETILPFFLRMACEYCGVSLGYRTVYYDFASYILSEHKNLWTEEEKEMEFPIANNHWDLYPEYQNEFEEYDTGILTMGAYFQIGMDIYDELSGMEKSYFAYAFLLFFLKYDRSREEDLMDEFRQDMNWMEED